jgi:acyl-CoA thioesterase
MGNFDADTAVEGSDGRWTAKLDADWNIWGPNGGYLATIALRAAGTHSPLPRPASFSCHYLGVARFDAVDLTTTTLRRAKRAESVRVSMTQDGQPILEALVWMTADDLAGLSHDAAPAPDVPGPDGLRTTEELLAGEDVEQSYPFWSNFDEKPLRWLPRDAWERREPAEPDIQTWLRFRPTPTFDDPYLDAGRLLVLLDTFQWPAATRAYRPAELTHIAPSLDLAAFFHRLDPGSEWLLAQAHSPVAADGLVGGRAAVWSQRGELLATGGQQMLCRPAAR